MVLIKNNGLRHLLQRSNPYKCWFHSKQFVFKNSKQFHVATIKDSRQIPFVRIGIITGFLGLLTYDGTINHFTYCGASLRFARSMKTATLVAYDYFILSFYEKHPNYDKKLNEVHQISAERFLETCLRNGGLYIKVGQGVAAINHIVPKEYTTTLSKLQNECLPTSKQEVQNLFLKDFGLLPEEMFREFNYEPIAAASLAQVFKATLPNGENVAVKVQYNHLNDRFASDLGTIIFLQDIVEFFFKGYNFGWILRDLRQNLVQELNFVYEGRNSERCARDLSKFPFVHIPKIHWDYTRTRVLTMEWINGFKISDMDNIRLNEFSLRDIDYKLFAIFAEQIFRTGFVHADPHPGNIFLRKNSRNGQADIILLDHGLYEEIPEMIRKPLCQFWEATVLRDEPKMKAAAKQLGIKDHLKFAEVLFQQPIRMKRGRIASKLTERDIVYYKELAQKNFELIMETLKEMPRNMLFVVRNLNTVRAIGRHHGDVVDRPLLMARHAQSCLYKDERINFVKSIYWIFHRAYFEYCLWSHSFKLRCMSWYLNILYIIGRAPESAKTMMHDISEQTLS